MIEREVERKLKREVEAIGGLCLKWESPGCAGVPDRIILLPDGRAAFAETKAPGRKERARQAFVQDRLRQMGFTVFSSVDGEEKIKECIYRCKEMINNNIIK